MRYLTRRLLFFILTLGLTSLLIFSVTRLLPGDVATILLGRQASESAKQALRETLGLDDPWPVQYARWVGDFVTGDWGTAHRIIGQPKVRPLVLAKLANSLRLALLTLLIAVPVALLLGVWAALREQRWADHLISLGSLSVVALPEFVTGFLLVQWLAHGVGWFPATATFAADKPFLQALPDLLLPALTATLVLLAYLVRLVRAGMIEELKKPYTRTAYLKGLPLRAVLLRHVLRNALLPTVTVVAISFGWLIGGLIVIENVFNYGGLGKLLADAIDARDLLLIQAITMVVVAGVTGANLLADLAYAWLNPRVRLK